MSEESEDQLTLGQQIAQAASWTSAEAAIAEAQAARKGEQHARQLKGALEAFHQASKAAPPKKNTKKGPSRAFSIREHKLGPGKGRPVANTVVLAGSKAAAGATGKEKAAQGGGSSQAAAKSKGKAPEVAGTKKAAVGKMNSLYHGSQCNRLPRLLLQIPCIC